VSEETSCRGAGSSAVPSPPLSSPVPMLAPLSQQGTMNNEQRRGTAGLATCAPSPLLPWLAHSDSCFSNLSSPSSGSSGWARLLHGHPHHSAWGWSETPQGYGCNPRRRCWDVASLCWAGITGARRWLGILSSRRKEAEGIQPIWLSRTQT